MKKQLTLKKVTLFVLSALLLVLMAISVAFTGVAHASADSGVGSSGSESSEHKDHDLGSMLTIKPATCVEPGVGSYYCNTCGYSFNVVIPADNKHHKLEPDGSTYKCTLCGKTGADAVLVPAETDKNDSNNIYVEAVESEVVTNLDIPAELEYEGTMKKVHIDDNAFANNDTLQKVTIDSAVDIGENAFADCGSIDTIQIKKNAEGEITAHVAADAFDGTAYAKDATKYKTVDGTKSLSIPVVDDKGGNVGYYLLKVVDPNAAEPEEGGAKPRAHRRDAAAETDKITSFTVPANTLVIASGAFKGLADLTTVTLNPELHTICENAFDGAANLSEIFIADKDRAVTKDSFVSVDGLNGFHTIYYTGQYAEKLDDIFSQLLGAIRYYSEEEPDNKDHLYWHRNDNGLPVLWSPAVKLYVDASACNSFKLHTDFSAEGLVVYVSYADGTSRLVTDPKDYTVDSDNFNGSETGSYVIYVKYKDYDDVTASYNVVVSNAYTVTTKYDNGTADKEEHFWALDASGKPATFTFPKEVPVRPGYTFLGWIVEDEGPDKLHQAGASYGKLDRDITIIARWEAKTPEVTVDLAQGKGTVTPSVSELSEDEEYTVTLTGLPTREGYTFMGWTAVINGEDVALTMGEDSYSVTFSVADIDKVQTIAISAVWEAKGPKVSFKLETAKGTPKFAVSDLSEDEKYTVTVTGLPTLEGYKFTGWSATINGKAQALTKGEDGSYSVTFPVADIDKDENVTITAQWQQLYSVEISSSYLANVKISGEAYDDGQKYDKEYYEEGAVLTISFDVVNGRKLVEVKDAAATEDGKYTYKVEGSIHTIEITVITDEVKVTMEVKDAEGVTVNVAYNDQHTVATLSVKGDPTKRGHNFTEWTVTVNKATREYTENLAIELGNADVSVEYTANWAINYGSEKDPLSVEDALYLATTVKKLEANAFTQEKVRAIGKIINDPTDKGGYLQNVIIQDLETSAQILIYTLNIKDGVDRPDKHDTIVIYGYIKNHHDAQAGTNTLEFASKGNDYVYTVKTTRGESDITVSAENGAELQLEDGSSMPATALNGTTLKVKVVISSNDLRVDKVKVNGVEVEPTGEFYEIEIHGDTAITITTADRWALVETKVATLNFGKYVGAKDGKTTGYTQTWNATRDGITWEISHFNNYYLYVGQDGTSNWTYIKTGRNASDVTGTIMTKAAMSEPIAKIVVDINTSSSHFDKVEAFYLEVAATNLFDSKDEGYQKISLTIETGENVFEIPSAKANMFYRLTVQCASLGDKNESNGFVVVNSVTYYTLKAPTDPNYEYSVSNAKLTNNEGSLDLSLDISQAPHKNAAYSLSVDGKTVAATLEGTTLTAKNLPLVDSTKQILLMIDEKAPTSWAIAADQKPIDINALEYTLALSEDGALTLKVTRAPLTSYHVTSVLLSDKDGTGLLLTFKIDGQIADEQVVKLTINDNEVDSPKNEENQEFTFEITPGEWGDTWTLKFTIDSKEPEPESYPSEVTGKATLNDNMTYTLVLSEDVLQIKVTEAVAPTPGEITEYTLVTDVEQLKEGYKVLFVYFDGKVISGAANVSGNSSGQLEAATGNPVFSSDNSKITDWGTGYAWKLQKYENFWNFVGEKGEKLGCKASKKITIYSGCTQTQQNWKIEIDGNAIAKVITQYTTSSFSGAWLQYNKSTNQFAPYTGTNGQIKIYMSNVSADAVGGGETGDADLQKAQDALNSLTIDDSKVTDEKTIELTQRNEDGVTFDWILENEVELDGVVIFDGTELYIVPDEQEHVIKLSVTATCNGKTTEKKEFTIQVSAISTGGGGDEKTGTIYTLDTTKNTGSNSSYTGSCDVTYESITWHIEGNSQTKPWRFGGNKITKVDRKLTSKTPLSGKVNQIIIEFGDSDITVNSVTLNVFDSNPLAETTPTAKFTTTVKYAKNSSVTVDAPSNETWSNCYFQVVFNVTNSTTKNHYVTIQKMEFNYAVSSDIGMEGPSPSDLVANVNSEIPGSSSLWLYVLGGSALLVSVVSLSALAFVLIRKKHN